MLMTATLVFYFLLLMWLSRRSGRQKGNDAFFRGGRQSPWWMVGFGMIGASISGVSFISVPGWVSTTGMTYLQMCAGFFFGYLAVAFLLLPLYYRLRLTSIYTYLGNRFGRCSHRTGALFFLLSKLTGAAARLYVVCLVLQQFLLPHTIGTGADGLYFGLTSAGILLLIWLYTRRSGIFTIVRTDALQTACLLLMVIIMTVIAADRLELDAGGMVRTIAGSPLSRVFEWDTGSPQNFWRQIVSGIFVVIVMTGLDQDMMQKNLTCRSLREAQKNMCAYGACFLPVNLLLLALGILLYTLCSQSGMPQPAGGDTLLPSLVAGGELGTLVIIPFTLGIVTAAFSSADSALTALTTSIAMTAGFLICILLFRLANDTNVINAIYVMASYTYGPLLGLYAFGLLTHRGIRDKWVPAVAITSPVVCALLDHFAPLWWNYTFGYELLMLNGLLTFAGLAVLSKKRK